MQEDKVLQINFNLKNKLLPRFSDRDDRAQLSSSAPGGFLLHTEIVRINAHEQLQFTIPFDSRNALYRLCLNLFLKNIQLLPVNKENIMGESQFKV